MKLKGWLFHGTGVRRGTVVYLHGSADNRASGTSIAERFLARGLDALAFRLPEHEARFIVDERAPWSRPRESRRPSS